MIKTVNGRTKAMGSKAELIMDFMGTEEALLERTKITAEQLHKAIKVAEVANEVAAKMGECFDDFNDEEPETENEPEKPAEVKIIVRKDGEKVADLAGDYVDEMLESLKKDLEELKEKLDD